MVQRSESKIGATCAVAGTVILFVGTYLHPMKADPSEAVAAFTEYAADRLWVASHLMQLAGFMLMVAALLFLARQLAANSTMWPRLAASGATASLTMATALQAVDGIALKTMVDTWAIAPTTEKEAAFYATYAVRQVEIGLASTASLLFGFTVIAYGVALLHDRMYPKWVAGLASVGGVSTVIGGMVMAYAGFSEWTMAISMPANILVLVWMLVVGVFMWRRGGSPHRLRG